MAELIKGVTKIRHIGDQLDKSIAGAGILTYVKALGGGHHLWEDVGGREYLWGLNSSEGMCWEFVDDRDATIPTKVWTDKHYDHYLTVKLTPEDIAAGEVKVKIDPYVVNELWGINTADKTGAGFHCLKTLSRMANAKNSLEREWDALIGQSTRARELLNK
jgi:hypothetical protein